MDDDLEEHFQFTAEPRSATKVAAEVAFEHAHHGFDLNALAVEAAGLRPSKLFLHATSVGVDRGLG